MVFDLLATQSCQRQGRLHSGCSKTFYQLEPGSRNAQDSTIVLFPFALTLMGTSPRPSNELLVPIEVHSFSVTPTKRSFAWTFGASDPVPLGKGSSCGSLLSHCCLFRRKRIDCLRCFSSQLGSWQGFSLGQALTMCPTEGSCHINPFEFSRGNLCLYS